MHLPLWLLLVVIYQVKHLIADYFLQGRYMLRKFLPGRAFILPLLAHVGVHAVGTLLITLFFVAPHIAIGLAFCDATAHFIIDRIKASPKLLGRFKSLNATTIGTATAADWRSNNWYWWSIGLYQCAHHICHYAIIWYLLR